MSARPCGPACDWAIGHVPIGTCTGSFRIERLSTMDVIAAVEEHQDEALKEKFRTAFACLQRCLDIYG